MGDTTEDQDDQTMVEAVGVPSFSELLMLSDGFLSSSEDHHREVNGGDGGEDSFGFVFSGTNGSKMLCFSGDCRKTATNRSSKNLLFLPEYPFLILFMHY
ncbi:unnamed protein product [Brassica rapa subsp. narinosa]